MGSAVTPEDAQKFERYMRAWQDKLNLRDWRIVRSNRATRHMSDVKIHLEDRLAVYRVGTDFGAEPVTEHTLERTAVHELLHVQLAELIDAAENGADTISAQHRIINTLERLLVPDQDE